MNSIAAVVFFAVVAAASAGIVAPSGFIASSYSIPALSAYTGLAYNAPLAYNTPLPYNAYSAPITALGQAAESTVVAGPSGTISNTKSVGTPAIAAGYALPYSTNLAYNAYSVPIATLGQAAESTVVAGPSGTISNTKSIGTPAIAAGYALPYSYGGLYL